MRRRWSSRFLPVLILALAAGAAWWAMRRWAPRSAPAPSRPSGTTVQVYYHRTAAPDQPPVAVARRLQLAEPSREALLRGAIRALLAGPTAAEKTRGFYTSIPAGARLLGARVERPFAYLDFSRSLEQVGGSARVKALLDQIAYTAASVRGVKGVILAIAGQRVGTGDRPFTGEGLLFTRLLPAVDSPLARRLGPADTLDLFIAAIPDRDLLWRLAGPHTRRSARSPAGLPTSALSEGLGSWRNYRVVREEVENGEATVVIAGRQVLEGQVEPNARYEAHLVRENGQWKWEML